MVVHPGKYDSKQVVAREIRREELSKLQAELPNNATLLKPFIMDVVGQHATFMERCKEVIKTLIEDKHIAQHKMKLIEHAAGLGGKDASNWMDQLQYLVDENEKMTTSLGEYKKRLKEMNHQAQEHYDYWLNYCSYLASGYELERTGVYEQLTRTQNELVELQTKWVTDKSELDRLKTENVAFKNAKGKLDMAAVTDAQIQMFQKELAEKHKIMAQQRTDKENLETRVKIMEEARSKADDEVSKLRAENNQLRLNMEDPSITELKEKIARQEELDEQQNLIMFVSGGESGGKQIKAIMPQKLLDRLTDQTILVSNDEAMIRTFLIVHRLLPIESEQVLARFTHRVDSCKDLKDIDVKLQQQISLRVCNILRMWIDELWDDFRNDMQLLTRLVLFVDTLKENKYSNLLRPILEKKLRPAVEEKPSNVVIPKPVIPKALAKRYSLDPRPSGASVAHDGVPGAAGAAGGALGAAGNHAGGSDGGAGASAGGGAAAGGFRSGAAAGEGRAVARNGSAVLQSGGGPAGGFAAGNGSTLLTLLQEMLAREGLLDETALAAALAGVRGPGENGSGSPGTGASVGNSALVANSGHASNAAAASGVASTTAASPSGPANTGPGAPTPSLLPSTTLGRRPPAPAEAQPLTLKFTDVDPAEFARQLTLIEFDLFKALKPHEFLDVSWMKEDKRKKAPNICRFTDWTNHVIKWIITEVVSVRNDAKQRAHVFERCVAIASHLHELKNFNGLKEVLAALDSSSIFRLKKTREALSDQCIKEFENLRKLVSHDMNSKMLRGKVRESIPPLIPFPGITQSDLVFLDSCGKNRMDNGMFNFQKYLKMVGYTVELLSYQRHRYWLEPVPEIQEYIRSMEVMNDEESYNASLLCESRN